MKKYILFIALFVCFTLSGQRAFQHKTTNGNITNSYMTTLSDTAIDGKSYAVIIIMPIKKTGERNNDCTKNYGVWYSVAEKKWKIFTEDKTRMPTGLTFNVLASSANPNYFSFTTTQEDITAHGFHHGSVFSHPTTNGKEDALILVTHNGGKGGTPIHDNNSLMVSYHNGAKKWSLAHHDYMAYYVGLTDSEQSFMRPDMTYNVMVVNTNVCSKFNNVVGFDNANAFLHTVDACTTNANTSTIGNFATFLEDPKANNTPTAMVFATPNWGWGTGANCGKTSGPNNESPICVHYGDPGNNFFKDNKWSILNVRTNALPHGMKFNVLVINSK